VPIPHIPERFLRHIWQQQHFNASQLRTSDGRPVTIISPGTLNTDGGPDFVNAKLRIGTTTFHGDVELHRDVAEWESHNHSADPHYNRVILHVVLTADTLSPPATTVTHRPIPLLVLHPYLDDTLRATWMKSILDERSERLQRIPCHSLNDEVPGEIILRWIEKLAHERMELKVRRFEERLKQLIDERKLVVREPYPRYYGNPDEIPIPQKEYTQRDFATKDVWEQVLYEGVMEALGYSKNRDPFVCLAQSMRLALLRKHSIDDRQTMMSMLFGVAGLLPSSRRLPDKESRIYVRALRRTWKQLRASFKGTILNEADWQFFRLRPSNFPTARLAVMCHLLPQLFGEDGFRTLIGIFKKEPVNTQERIATLHSLFQIEPDEFWNHHVHFKGGHRTAGISIGAGRINDIIVNIAIPVALLYARIFKDHAVRTGARRVLGALPPLQENSMTDTIQIQLLKGKGILDSPLLQQGAMQLFKFFCSPVRCAECDVGRRTALAGRRV